MGLPNIWNRRPGNEVEVVETCNNSSEEVIHDGNLAYVSTKAQNGSKAAYQEAVGAPVESKSPLGYNVGWMTVIFLNVNQMIGSGIFSTPGTILNNTGSIGLALMYWTIGVFIAITGFCVYLELAAFFPNRSGADVVYLEQAYPRPKHFFPIAYAVYSVLLSFILSNYIWALAGRDPSDWQVKGVAVAAYTLAVFCVVVHNKYSLWATNIFGAIKILTLVFISITGWVILGGNVSRVSDPGANFRNAFEGTTTSGNQLSIALVNVIFSYTGYTNAFSVVNEVKNPIPTIKRHGAASIAVVAVLYMFCNIAYFAAVPKQEFAQSNEIAASVFFGYVIGTGGAQAALNVLVLISNFGNLMAVLIGQSRMIREVGRQGVLPWTKFWVSTKPFGTPIGPYFLKWVMTFIMIVAPPAGDAFQFVVSLKTYPDGLFSLAMAIGLYIIRYRHKRLGHGKTEFKAWDVFVVFFVLVQVYIIATPWIPPEGGAYSGEVSFWYATYCVVGIAIIVTCALYYIAWMYLFPKWLGYRIRPEVSDVGDEGANTHRLVRIPVEDLNEWDADHDEAGRVRRRHVGGSPRDSQGEADPVEKESA